MFVDSSFLFGLLVEVFVWAAGGEWVCGELKCYRWTCWCSGQITQRHHHQLCTFHSALCASTHCCDSRGHSVWNGTQFFFVFFALFWLDPSNCRPPLGFYLISPSEFERFSLSTRCLVEPRCLVEVPLHSGSSNQHRSQPDGASSAHRYLQWRSVLLERHYFFQRSFVSSVLAEASDWTARMQVQRSETSKRNTCMCHWLRTLHVPMWSSFGCC